ncbi:alpha/beta fold hydrolase [Solimicrobium silvestre]|uniref:Alpha/beta hydrolase family n=1 Tax=Solimicrobium silvestre TaxID=2099400 RepID=A0A2S9H1L5_9BURK|nr:alpha/beta hydrolase [Solimicrobium silvestre]PRC93833.1 Alpha/beta hydrolase family [Solimicrobium silvestre]
MKNHFYSVVRCLASLMLFGLFCQAYAEDNVSHSVLNIQVTGSGKPMILIPGLASSGEVWDSTVAHYAKDYQCIVITLAGFAGKPAVDTPLFSSAEKELSRYISDKKLDHPIIVGHSLGGFLAMQFAAQHPEQVGKVVIVDSLPALGATQMPSVTKEQLQGAAANMRDNMRQSDPAQALASRRMAVTSMVSKPADIERVMGWGAASDRNTVINAMYELMATDLRDDIAQIKAPTLVLGTWIAYQEYAPRSAIENTFKMQYQKLPGVKIAFADTARHFIMYDDPQWMFAQMDEFLK